MIETPVRARTLTAEEFWEYCSGRDDRLELVEGRVSEMSPPGPVHGMWNSRFDRLLGTYVEEQGLGLVVLDAGFTLQRNPDLVRAPDQAFVSQEKIAAYPMPEEGFWEVVPDLVVEFISPGDRAQEINDKVMEYLDAGVRLVWLVYPRKQQVHVYRPGASVEILPRNGTLTGDGVVPGFTLQLESYWR